MFFFWLFYAVQTEESTLFSNPPLLVHYLVVHDNNIIIKDQPASNVEQLIMLFFPINLVNLDLI